MLYGACHSTVATPATQGFLDMFISAQVSIGMDPWGDVMRDPLIIYQSGFRLGCCQTEYKVPTESGITECGA